MSSSHFRWNERKSLVKWKLEISLLFIQTKIVLFHFFFLKTAIFSKYLQVGTKQLVTSSIIVPRISLLVDYSSNRVNSLSVVIGCQLLFKGGRRNKKKKQMPTESYANCYYLFTKPRLSANVVFLWQSVLLALYWDKTLATYILSNGCKNLFLDSLDSSKRQTLSSTYNNPRDFSRNDKIN